MMMPSVNPTMICSSWVRSARGFGMLSFIALKRRQNEKNQTGAPIVYLVQARTRKPLDEMTQKLSVTSSQ